MPRRWFVRLWFVVALSCLAAMSATQAGSGDQSRAPQPTSNVKPLPPSDHLPAILWYRNAIHDVAVDVCRRRGDLCVEILSILQRRFLRLAAQCRWLCPPGDCGPDCQGYRKQSFRDVADVKRIPANFVLPAIEWYTNELENAAIESDKDQDSFEQVRRNFKETFNEVLGVRSKE